MAINHSIHYNIYNIDHNRPCFNNLSNSRAFTIPSLLIDENPDNLCFNCAIEILLVLSK